MRTSKIQISKDYSKFYNSSENRNVNLKSAHARQLRRSLKSQGWIPSFPMSVFRNGKSGYKILDGQHRFAIAREIGMPVKFVEVDQEFEISHINEMQKGWSLLDYLERWKKAGKKEYFELEEFIDNHPSVDLGTSISLLSNVSGSSSLKPFKLGKFKITKASRGMAYRIANAYEKIVTENKEAKHRNHIRAITKCVKVDEFDIDRLVDQYKKYSYMIQSYSKIEDWLDLMQEIYNHRMHTKIPLKFLVENK